MQCEPREKKKKKNTEVKLFGKCCKVYILLRYSEHTLLYTNGSAKPCNKKHIYASSFLEINKLILKLTRTGNRPRVVNTTLKTIFKTYYLISRFIINYSNQDVCCLWKNRNTDQWNKIGCLEINLNKHCQLIFGKGTKAIQWRMDTVFSTNDAGKTGNL